MMERDFDQHMIPGDENEDDGDEDNNKSKTATILRHSDDSFR
jgi:hypothetical protein